MALSPFTPGRTLTISVADTSISQAINADEPQVALYNAGPELVFVAFGTGPTTADETGFPIPANATTILTKGVGANTIAAISPDPGPSTLYVTPGVGG